MNTSASPFSPTPRQDPLPSRPASVDSGQRVAAGASAVTRAPSIYDLIFAMVAPAIEAAVRDA